jgi:hypothetical protein
MSSRRLKHYWARAFLVIAERGAIVPLFLFVICL